MFTKVENFLFDSMFYHKTVNQNNSPIIEINTYLPT